MPDENTTRKHTRVGVNVQVKVSDQSVEDFVEHYATNISRGGIFIQCREPKPEGTILLFEIRLKGGRVVVRGKGEVIWARSRSEDASPAKPPGMGVKFLSLDKASRAVVKRILELKAGRETVRAQPEEAGEKSLEEIPVDLSASDFLQSTGEKLPEGLSLSHVIGIDLGTTNSCAAVVLDGQPKIVPIRGGANTIPSVVACSKGGEFLVGHDAKAQMETSPAQTIYGFKRLMGRPYTSPVVRTVKNRFPWEIVEGPGRLAAARINGRTVGLVEVASLILRELKDFAEELVRDEIHRAVICVPAHYNENQRQAVRMAGRKAALTVDRIVNEPTAAAVAYGYKKGLEKKILVYDMGGGTFDISLLDVWEDTYEVVSTRGYSFLGGLDFDKKLADHVLERFRTRIGRLIRPGPVALQRLLNAAEHAKIALSGGEKATVRVPYFVQVDDEPVDLEIEVTRQVLEELVSPLVDRSMDLVEKVLAEAKRTDIHFDDILLVGGQTRMPMIRRRLTERFSRKPQEGVHPDEAVAVGAALLGHALGKIDNVLLIDALAVSIGYGLPGGGFRPVLVAGSTLPTSANIVIQTEEDEQTELHLLIFQGENPEALGNEYLLTATIIGITPAPRGKVRLKVTFSQDLEGTFRVTATEYPAGQERKVALAPLHNEAAIRNLLGMRAAKPADAKSADDNQAC